MIINVMLFIEIFLYRYSSEKLFFSFSANIIYKYWDSYEKLNQLAIETIRDNLPIT